MSMSWRDWHYEHAALAARKSKDTTQVGAALVGPMGEVRLTAYNGPPRGVLDLPDRLIRPRKYLYASHAEMNLIAFAAREGIKTDGCVIYVTHHPCSACARLIIQAGVEGVIYGAGATCMPEAEFTAAQAMFEEADVAIEPVKGEGEC